MTAVLPTASQISASEERGAIFNQYVTGEAMSLGQAVYLDSNGLAWKAKADTAAHATAIGIAVIAPNFAGETTIPVGSTVGVVVFGPVYGFNHAVSGGTDLVPGTPLWVDKTTAGSMNTVAPTTAYQFIVGHSIDNDTFFVDPGTTSPVSA